MTHSSKYSTLIRQEAQRLGFSFVGFSKARQLDEAARRLENWLNQGNHGEMRYMENHFEKRIDPTKLVPGAKSVISLLFNYHSDKKQQDVDAPRISTYAYGTDYHFILKDKLKTLLEFIRDHVGHVEGRCFVDSAPVLEREWARLGGLGWVGKNTMLIHPKAGSYYFLAEIISDLDVSEHNTPLKDYCGTCTRCIDACPTDAISSEGYVLDGSKCISYLTIELRDAIPESFRDKMENWMFGCDICQEVCPWNRFSTPNNEPAFQPSDELLQMQENDWIELTEETFRRVFKKSPVKRTKFNGLQRNIKFLKE